MSAARPARLRAAVVGVGTMGAHHARIYSSLKDIDLVAVVDPDRALAQRVAETYDCAAFASAEELVGRVDLASVAAPSVEHANIAKYLLRHGIHCLVEKPMAISERECLDIIAAAERAGVVLQIGHIERFNPAVRQLSQILSSGQRVHAFEAQRMSATSARVTDVDVVLDLMIHDLDVVLSLVSADVADLSAVGVRAGPTSGVDYATALLSFTDGAVASLTASRITQSKVRQLNLTTETGYFTLNYTTQELLIFRQNVERQSIRPLATEGNYVLDVAMERVLVRNFEPLLEELRDFVACVVTGKRPLVGGAEGLAALRLAWRIRDRLDAGGNP